MMAVKEEWDFETKTRAKKQMHVIMRSGENGMAFVVDEHRALEPLDVCNDCAEEIEAAENKLRYGR